MFCDSVKFEYMLDFVVSLFRICVCVDVDMLLCGLGVDKVLVIIVYLLEVMMIWVGNDIYVCDNKLYGLIILCDCYVCISGSNV